MLGQASQNSSSEQPWTKLGTLESKRIPIIFASTPANKDKIVLVQQNANEVSRI